MQHCEPRAYKNCWLSSPMNYKLYLQTVYICLIFVVVFWTLNLYDLSFESLH